MSMPEWWKPSEQKTVMFDGKIIGNDHSGPNVAVHSLAILPEFQKNKLGRKLMRSYIEHLRQEVPYAEVIVIIAHDYLVPFYESLGFQNNGPSECLFAGGAWFDMVCSILLLAMSTHNPY